MKKKIAALLLLGVFAVAGCGVSSEPAADLMPDDTEKLESVDTPHEGMIPYVVGVKMPPDEAYDYDTDTVYTNLMPVVMFVNPYDEDVTFRVKDESQDFICESITKRPGKIYAFSAWASFPEDANAEIEAVSKTGEVLGTRSIFFDTTPQEELLANRNLSYDNIIYHG